MKQENNNILNLFSSLSKILSKPNDVKAPTQSQAQTNKPTTNSKSTIDFIRAHELRKKSIIDKNK